MMEDTLDKHGVVTHAVEDTMTLMHLAARAGAVFRARLTGKRKFAEQGKGFLESTRIGRRYILAELLCTVGVNRCEIAPRGRAQLDSSHAARGVR